MVGVLRAWVCQLGCEGKRGCSAWVLQWVQCLEGLRDCFGKLRDPNLEITPQTSPAGFFGVMRLPRVN